MGTEFTQIPADRYTLDHRLGSGGYGEVFRGTQVQIGRPVAIKLLHPHLAERPNIIQRFRREARLLSRIRHPNVVAVHDFHAEAGLLYLVMEFLEGPTLRQWSRANAPLSWASAVDIAARIAGGLRAVHDGGLIHRDLKPSNILLAELGGELEPVLIDFGLAASAEADDDESVLTNSEQMLGTPLYISPEVARGQGATAASDIYALGVILFELIAGRVPFRGGHIIETLRLHAYAPMPPLASARGEHLPAEFDTLIRDCLQKIPEDRPDLPGIIERLHDLRSTPGNAPSTFGLLREQVARAHALAESHDDDDPDPRRALEAGDLVDPAVPQGRSTLLSLEAMIALVREAHPDEHDSLFSRTSLLDAESAPHAATPPPDRSAAPPAEPPSPGSALPSPDDDPPLTLLATAGGIAIERPGDDDSGDEPAPPQQVHPDTASTHGDRTTPFSPDLGALPHPDREAVPPHGGRRSAAADAHDPADAPPAERAAEPAEVAAPGGPDNAKHPDRPRAAEHADRAAATPRATPAGRRSIGATSAIAALIAALAVAGLWWFSAPPGTGEPQDALAAAQAPLDGAHTGTGSALSAVSPPGEPHGLSERGTDVAGPADGAPTAPARDDGAAAALPPEPASRDGQGAGQGAAPDRDSESGAIVAAPPADTGPDAARAGTALPAAEAEEESSSPARRAEAPAEVPPVASGARTARVDAEEPVRRSTRRSGRTARPVVEDPAPRDLAPGRLNVVVHPGGEVWVNGRAVGRSPVRGFEVEAGRVRVRTRSGDQEREETVEVAPGELQRVVHVYTP
ncbi:MAG: serine/threonine protein kinase [Deltaproteobacteria bacterium]|nr:MAG: serine/threonine protein kinase [Deltaproteobacteria bacterium]